jgi:hypothetical protein
MTSGKLEKTVPNGRGLRPLTEEEAGRIVGGDIVRPDIGDTGGSSGGANPDVGVSDLPGPDGNRWWRINVQQ